MDPVSWIGLASILVLTGLNALLGVAENAALELPRHSVEPDSPSVSGSARRLARLLENRSRFWVSARLGAALLTFLSVALAATTVADALTQAIPSQAGRVALAVGLLAALHAVLARVVPRILAQRYPQPLAHRLSMLIWLQYVAFLPLTKLFERLLSPAEQQAWKGPDREEVAVIGAVEEGAREGAIDAHDIRMISNVIDLGDRVARQVMTPRPDIVAVEVDMPVREALALAHARGMSRLPVYEGDLDHVVGILHVREGVAALLDSDAPVDLRSLVLEAYFLPESKRVDLLLRELQARKMHMAIVVNEFGETAGLVTIEDLLEEIVGEIEDEFDEPEVQVEHQGDGEAVVDAGVPIADVNEALGLTLFDEDVDTVGGLVYNAFGRVPNEGETVTVNGASIEVMETRDNRIMRLRIRKLPEPPEDGG